MRLHELQLRIIFLAGSQDAENFIIPQHTAGSHLLQRVKIQKTAHIASQTPIVKPLLRSAVPALVGGARLAFDPRPDGVSHHAIDRPADNGAVVEPITGQPQNLLARLRGDVRLGVLRLRVYVLPLAKVCGASADNPANPGS